MLAAIVKPKAGPSGDAYSEEDWNTEVDENAQGADAYRYSKVAFLLFLDLHPFLSPPFLNHISYVNQCFAKDRFFKLEASETDMCHLCLHCIYSCGLCCVLTTPTFVCCKNM